MIERNGWEADERPEPRSLGLLPSGPDPVGEWLVHRQPPIAYIGRARPESKRGRFRQPQRFDSVRKSLRFGKASDLHRRLASFAIRVIYPAVLSITLSGLAAAQHDDRGQPSPQQHPGGGPPPGKPFISPRGPIGQPPGAQVINPGIGRHPRGEIIRPGGPPPGAEVVRPGGPPLGFVPPGGPHRGAEFARPGGARLSRRNIRARADGAVRLPARLGLPALGSRRIPAAGLLS